MRSKGLVPRSLAALFALGAIALAPRLVGAQAAGPLATVTPTSTRLQIGGASLTDAIDALARAAKFKVTYDGPRPATMIFNADIDTATVSQTLVRLLDGQNLNYAVVLDVTGKNVTWLMVLGPPTRTASGPASSSPGATARPQPFATPRSPRNEPPPVDDDPPEEAEAAPAPAPSVSPTPAASGTPYQVSPFGPRSPFGPSPNVPRPSPSPSP